MAAELGQEGGASVCWALGCGIENVTCSLIGKLATLWANTSALSQGAIPQGADRRSGGGVNPPWLFDLHSL